MLRFIAICMGITFVFVLTLPAIQVASLFQQSGHSPQSVTTAQEEEHQTPEEDPFDLFTSNEPSADALSAIAPATGDGGASNETFGEFFYSEQHPGFDDKVETTQQFHILDIDL
jgi:hypothetical protein